MTKESQPIVIIFQGFYLFRECYRYEINNKSKINFLNENSESILSKYWSNHCLIVL